MDKRTLGPAEVPVIGQGTWNIDEARDRKAAIETLRRGIDLGMTHIDTAEFYGSGASESMVGEAIAGRRDDVFLVSKVMPQNASRKGTITACERSLAFLKTAYLDCYLLHWRGRYPLAETFEAFAQLKQEGKIRSWGVSNFDVPDLEEALQAGDDKPACNQVLYHLKERAIEHRVIPWCQRHGIAVVAYSPFGQNEFPTHSKVLQQIASSHNATARQVALRFLLRCESVLTIPKASSVAHVTENAGAGRLQLAEEEVKQIDAAFPAGPPARHLPML
jgi:diketogulonate reductase-like aldo/keto reductase